MENTKLIKSVDKVSIHGLVATYTKASTKMTRGMVTDRCSGPMEACTKENGSEAFNTELEEWFSLP